MRIDARMANLLRPVARVIASIRTAAVAVTMLSLTAFQANAHLVDDFSRADGAGIGNAWIEKTPEAFSLSNGRVVKQAVGTWYRDNVVYRPAAEDVLDVEASIEFTLSSLPPGYPQIFVRLQSATVATTDVLDGYILFFEDNANFALLARQTGNQYPVTLGTLNLTQPINTSGTYRMRLSATGTDPVQLTAFVERLDDGIWQVIGQAYATDSSSSRIASAGAVGFSGYIESSYSFDNFTRVELSSTGTANPLPATVALAPSAALQGESELTLVVYGSGFTTDSRVRWNGSERATVYVSPSELEATLTSADLSVSGSYPISVANPSPGGGVSGTQSFQVTGSSNPPPTLLQLAPVSVTAGNTQFTLQVSGTNFDAGSVVRWNGDIRPTTYVSATQLQATITTADVATPGSAAVTVLRQSDALVTAAQTFTISAPVVAADFTDDFDRPDNDSIGNGWIEKSQAAFTISGNEAAKVAAAGNDYRNNVVYRPASEDLLDVEASIELRLLSLPAGYPQVLVRAQSDTIASTNTLDAYLLYMNDSATQAVIARQRGGNYDQQLRTFTLSPALNTTDRYRLRLRATGTNPVVLNAYVERFANGNWAIIGQGSYSDTASTRIATAGSVGFGGYVETNYRYDNFARTNFGTPSPTPQLNSINPASASAGSPAINITITGSDFTNGSLVRWNGADRSTTFVSSTQLTAQIDSADLASQGSGSVTVFTPAPGGGTSAAQTFTITAPANNPVPSVTALSPGTRPAGSGAFLLTVNGGNFVPASVVRWNGTDRSTTYVSSTELRAQITANDIADAGVANVLVINPAPAGGSSGTIPFTVTAAANPAPVLSGLTPSSAIAGTPGFTLTVTGSNFVNGSVVRWNGSPRSTTFVSSTELSAVITNADLAASGSRSVTVYTAGPGGGESSAQTFAVNAPQATNPVPVLNQMSPNAAVPGSGATMLTVLGSGFTSESVVRWNGSARTTTYISSTELQTTLNSADLASARLAAVTVNTPAPGGGSSVPLTFFVQDGSLNYFFDGFNRPNSDTIGNDWTEKNPDAFSILDNQVVSQINLSGGFQQEIMYRPSGEDRMDGEVSVEFVRRSMPSNPGETTANFPQVHARVQRDNLQQPYTLDSYIFFIDDVSGDAMFAVTRSPTPGSRWECYIEALPLSQPLVEGDRYRLRFRIMGAFPVQMNGVVERFDEGTWQAIASGSTTHDESTQRNPALYCDFTTMAPPITTAGGFGVAKWVNRTDNYDNFFWRDLEPGSAPPAVSSLNPQAVQAGSTGFQLTVNGTGFSPDTVVRWNGANRTTTYVSPTQLQATITADDVAQSGLAAVSVLTPGSGLVSGSVSFNITAAAAVETLFDNFDRADSPDIGNGWIEKSAGAFALAGGRMQKLATPGADYRNNVVYRQSSEDVLNVEASAEFRLLGTPVGYPQLLVRGQANTIAGTNQLDAYLLYMNDSTSSAVIARQRGTNYDVPVSVFGLSQALNTNDTYRLRLSAQGTNPVRLTAYIERLNAGTWQLIGQASYDDYSSDRISTAGTVGIGGFEENTYAFDNFRRLYLGN